MEYYLCIDIKSFFASVECVERGLDPMKTRLVVADPERGDGTICLAVTPEMKRLGVRNRCRVFEIPGNIDYIKAPPRMRLYLEYSAKVYKLFLKYVSKDDIHVYSVDEAFLYVTPYLGLYKTTAQDLAKRICRDIYDTLGLTVSCGLGSNLYLAKIALDITAKKSPDFFGILDEDKYRETLWDHRPLTDFWRIGPGIAKRLADHGIFTMRGVAYCPTAILTKMFGVDAKILRDHAWGVEPTKISEIKNYRTENNSLSSGQVLMRDYAYAEAEVILSEMTETLWLELFEKELETYSVSLSIGYADYGDSGGSRKFSSPTSSLSDLTKALKNIYEVKTEKDRPIRRITIAFGNVVKEKCEQLSFDDAGKENEKRLSYALIGIKNKYGKNALFRGHDLYSFATKRERNMQIGGHKSGER